MESLVALWLHFTKVTKEFCERRLVAEDPYQRYELVSKIKKLKAEDPEEYEILSKTHPFYQEFLNGRDIDDLYKELNPAHAPWSEIVGEQ